MLNKAGVVVLLAAAVTLQGCASSSTGGAGGLVTTDNFVPHTSTLQQIKGQRVGLFVRQIAPAQAPADMKGRVVLFVHGATVPSVPDFALEHGDYNWMGFLARAGFNTYSMDLSGYGGSPRPMMDDPCNVNPKQQNLIAGKPLRANCAPNHARDFNTIRDDWAEMDAVVDHLRKVNKVDRIHIIGWSAGGPRVGGYVSQNPEKIDRVMLYAPSPVIKGPIPEQPGPGFPVQLQTRDDMERLRWDPDVRCPGQIEPGVRDAVWKSIMQWDRVGESWGKDGAMRGRTATGFGWTEALSRKVVSPTLVVVGEFDRLAERRTVYEQIASQEKVFLDVACASHFMVWEKQYKVLHESSLQWLRDGHVKGVKRGEFRVEYDGRYLPAGK
ncbi:MAG: alpha/beta hydrolase [Burkholderiales bacterium]|nr:alpha/beta hydrolase [Burkholderiales bacterium]